MIVGILPSISVENQYMSNIFFLLHEGKNPSQTFLDIISVVKKPKKQQQQPDTLKNKTKTKNNFFVHVVSLGLLDFNVGVLVK